LPSGLNKPSTSIKLGKLYVLPIVLAAFIVWYGATALSHLAFNVADSMGAFCKGSPPNELVRVDLGIAQNAKDFDTSSMCAATGLTVETGRTYELIITVATPWADGSHTTTPVGYRTSTLEFSERWHGYAGILLRRVMFRPWFRPIARVGETGTDEYFLDPVLQNDSNPPVYKARFTAQRKGEVFLYVNDAVIGLPWVNYNYFKNNQGTAKITARLM
jgi:hypothetical protein